MYGWNEVKFLIFSVCVCEKDYNVILDNKIN